MKQGLPSFSAAIAAGLMLCACDSKPKVSDGRLVVAATTTMIADMVATIGGEHVRVIALIPPGTDPHTSKLSKNDERALDQAKVIFTNGLMLEGGLGRQFDEYRRHGGVVLELASAINEANRKKFADGHYDPHIWGDPRLWALCATVVVKGLCDADPAHAPDYLKRGTELKSRCMDLFEWCQQRIGQVPPEARALVTSHDGFNYFADAFGFKIAAEAQAAQFIKGHGVKVVFMDNTGSREAMERISKECGAKLGGELLSDSPGKKGEIKDVGDEKVDQGTYIGMLKSNVHTIVKALK